MAVNLRLSDEAAQALREAARTRGRSQQELLREAVDRYLGVGGSTPRDRHVAAGLVREPTPFQDEEPTVTLRAGLTSLDLLDRDER